MTPELEEYFTNYNELFNHDGFKQLIEELSNNAKQLADIQTVKDEEDLFFRKGQVSAFATVINLESTITLARDQAEAEDQEQEDVYNNKVMLLNDEINSLNTLCYKIKDTFKHFKIKYIFVDDGSKDGSLKWLQNNLELVFLP